jgi:demethylmenaquinone methyltransferase / 2-methoxy-6-polyprenyl-1,4-benzoquinol methylase
VASGTADLALQFAKRAGAPNVWQTDINEAMLRVGRDRLINEGLATPNALADAEKLPFASEMFDVVTVAFGLRNMTHKDVALAEMTRVLKPGGRLFVLEFSKVHKSLEKAYDMYSFSLLPKIGKWVAKDEASYQYLAESIRMHPDQDTLKQMMADAGLSRVEYWNLAAGVVALHRGFKS